jgi:hypothetical protein
MLALAALCGCGLENMLGNLNHTEFDRPASVIRGAATWAKASPSQLTVLAPDGSTVQAFQAQITGGVYELRLPAASYSMLRVKARAGNLELRAIVPVLGSEEVAQGVDLDARNTAETLITEARLTADKANGGLDADFTKVSPAAYAATRALIRAAFSAGGPTADLLNMVTRIIKPVPTGLFDSASGVSDPDFFSQPVLDKTYKVTTSAISSNALVLNPLDYVGDGKVRQDASEFDAKLGAVAKLYSPTGCDDPDHVRVVFSVDFNPADLINGYCSTLPQFKWATNKPGKSMFFVGWIHKDSDIQLSDPDPVVAAGAQAFFAAMGSGAPNNVLMADDGANGDEKAGDNVWTISFVAPRSKPGKVLRIGYKYTWGYAGAVWSGSEEWPGNSRILEVVDVNGDNVVNRRDVWADESSNKDNGNLNPNSGGTITWKTDLHGCGQPESQENQFFPPVSCKSDATKCLPLLPPLTIGPVKVACSGN